MAALVGHQSWIQPRQDYVIARKARERRQASKIAQEVRKGAESCAEMGRGVLVGRCVDEACRFLRSDEERRFGPTT